MQKSAVLLIVLVLACASSTLAYYDPGYSPEYPTIGYYSGAYDDYGGYPGPRYPSSVGYGRGPRDYPGSSWQMSRWDPVSRYGDDYRWPVRRAWDRDWDRYPNYGDKWAWQGYPQDRYQQDYRYFYRTYDRRYSYVDPWCWDDLTNYWNQPVVQRAGYSSLRPAPRTVYYHREERKIRVEVMYYDP